MRKAMKPTDTNKEGVKGGLPKRIVINQISGFVWDKGFLAFLSLAEYILAGRQRFFYGLICSLAPKIKNPLISKIRGFLVYI